MIAAHVPEWLHFWRVATIVLLLAVPGALTRRIHTRRTWLIVGAIELSLVGSAATLATHWGTNLVVWYRTPRVFVEVTLLLLYVALEWREHRAKGRV